MTARILIIAGSDSGGGAGIQADIKTVTMLGGHAMTAITAITAQNTQGVRAISGVSEELLLEQIFACVEDIGVDAIKVGMLPDEAAVRTVAAALLLIRQQHPVPVVIDPVLVATSGDALAGDGVAAAMKARLFPLATLITPNLPELAALGGEAEIKGRVLVKGGHDTGDIMTDRLVENGRELRRWQDARIATRHTHGTGCTLSTAIATSLAQGLALDDAIGRARSFVRLALLSAPGLGQGYGPMGHQDVRNDGTAPGPILNQITIGARDYDASLVFYRRLGLRLIVDSPTNGYARFEAGNGVSLSIHADTGPAGGATVYLESPRLDAWVAELQVAGFSFDHVPQDESWLWREARLRDPHGNSVCLYQAGEARRFPPWRVKP